MIVWKQRLALTEEISCGAFMRKNDPVTAFLFQRHYSSALVLQKESVNGEYCANTKRYFAECISAKGREFVVKYCLHTA